MHPITELLLLQYSLGASITLPTSSPCSFLTIAARVPQHSWVCAQPQLTPPAMIDSILHLSFQISFQIQFSPLLTNQQLSKYFQKSYICYTWKPLLSHLFSPGKLKGQVSSFKQQFHQPDSVFHRCKSLLPWPGSTNSNMLSKEVVMFFPIRKKH